MNALMWGRRRRRTGGLTLIEMVLATVVLGLVAVSVAIAFTAASDLVEKGRGRTELVQAGRAAMNRLLAELRTVVTIEARSDNYLRVYCSGTTASGSFSRRVEFWVEDDTLWRRVEGEDKQALAENVESFWTGGLMLWSKLGSSTDVLYPQVGPAGAFSGVSAWQQVYFGPGYWSQDDSSGYVYFPTANVLSDERGTLEFWYKPEFSAEWSGSGDDKYLVDTDDSDGRIELFYDESKGRLEFQINEESSLRVRWESTWAPDQVVHVAIVWDCTGRDIGEGRTMALYVNGLRCEEEPTTATWDSEALGPHVGLGGSDDEDKGAEAAFENLRIYDYCKTDFRDRYVQQAPGLMRVRLDLADDETGQTFTIESGVMAQ